MSTFTPSKSLQESLEERPADRDKVVAALIKYLYADPNMQSGEFEAAVRYVESRFPQERLYQPFDPDYHMETDKAKWDRDYRAQAVLYLQKNFCRERIDHVKALAVYLRPSAPGQNRSSDGNKKQARSVTGAQGGNKSTGKKSPDRIFPVLVVLIVLLIIIVFLGLTLSNASTTR